MPAATQRMTAPNDTEYGAPYARYVSRVPAGDIVATLGGQLADTAALLHGLDPSRTTVGYAPGKWSIRDILLHVADTERIMSYRALRIARGDATPLPGFDEATYAPIAGANARSVESLLNELAVARASTVALFDGLPGEAWDRRGTASGMSVSVRGLAWIIAGHERHHAAVVRERYLDRQPG